MKTFKTQIELLQALCYAIGTEHFVNFIGTLYYKRTVCRSFMYKPDEFLRRFVGEQPELSPRGLITSAFDWEEQDYEVWKAVNDTWLGYLDKCNRDEVL